MGKFKNPLVNFVIDEIESEIDSPVKYYWAKQVGIHTSESFTSFKALANS